MNIGVFGGTFDPIHLGHLALARAAAESCDLTRVLFVPASFPPHKQQPIASYFHRYAMAALATCNDKSFVPSLLEAPDVSVAPASGKKISPAAATVGRVNYSIDTIRRYKQSLKKIDRVFFLIGIDAFRDIGKWHESEALFRECAFIVASRPGYSLADVANSLPEKLRPKESVTKPFAKSPAHGDLVLDGVTVHLLGDVHSSVSATAVRAAVAAKKPLARLVGEPVAAYIKKSGLYAK